MKKFFFYFSICLAFQFFSLGHAKWLKSHCQKINNTEIKCTKTTEEKLINPISFYKKTTTYVGEGKNGLPSGKGEIEMSYSSYSQKEWEDDIRFLPKTMKGVFEFLPDIELVQLIDGTIETNIDATEYVENGSIVKTVLPSGRIWLYKDDVVYKIIEPKGMIFEGIVDEYNEPLEGTVQWKDESNHNLASFTGKFTKSGSNKRPMEGTLYLKNGDKFIGTLDDKVQFMNGKYLYQNGEINFFKNSIVYKKILINETVASVEGVFHQNGWLKEGTAIYRSSADTDIKKYVGSLDEKGTWIKGTVYFKNGDKYSGTFKNKNNKREYLNGKFYYANGKIVKVKNGFSGSTQTERVGQVIKNRLNFYWIFAIIILGIFLFYKFKDDKYEKKKTGKKLDFATQLTQFMNSPIGTSIMLIIIGVALFKLFNWAITDLEPGRPRFHGDVP